jgi:hypothetical protein
VMFQRRIRSIGAISALRGSETSGSQAPSIETAGTGPRRPTLALAFAALYFHLDATGSCGQLGCPEFSQANAPASIEIPHGVLVAVIAGFPAAALAGLIRRRFASDRKPAEVYLSRSRPASTSGCLVRFPGLYRRRSLLRRSRGS